MRECVFEVYFFFTDSAYFRVNFLLCPTKIGLYSSSRKEGLGFSKQQKKNRFPNTWKMFKQEKKKLQASEKKKLKKKASGAV